MMRIILSLDERSIDDAIDDVRQFREHLKDNLKRVCKRLAEIGAEHMRETYAGAAYGGTNDVSVSYEMDGSTAIITASGYTVGFIEFGTGVQWHMPAHGIENGIPPHGSYGQNKGATGKPWVYVGEMGQGGVAWPLKDRKTGAEVPGRYMTRGNPPANAIPRAVAEMHTSFADVVREVFG